MAARERTNRLLRKRNPCTCRLATESTKMFTPVGPWTSTSCLVGVEEVCLGLQVNIRPGKHRNV